VALVYLVGGASLSLRYESFDLPGQHAAAQTPRETLLAAGVRTLVVWALVGVLLVVVLRAVDDKIGDRPYRFMRKPAGIVAVLAVAFLLLLVLRVWWPLATFGAVLIILFIEARPGTSQAARTLTAALAVAVVAIAYEADRLTYYVEWTCVDRLAESAQSTGERTCGVLVGQQDRGFYVAVPDEQYRLVFIPAGLVDGSESSKRKAEAVATRAHARRERLISRFGDFSVR
jgi:hypothetical protein